ncbi:hypothetical protein D3C84_1014480 [compost metagenome]
MHVAHHLKQFVQFTFHRGFERVHLVFDTGLLNNLNGLVHIRNGILVIRRFRDDLNAEKGICHINQILSGLRIIKFFK